VFGEDDPDDVVPLAEDSAAAGNGTLRRRLQLPTTSGSYDANFLSSNSFIASNAEISLIAWKYN